MDRNSDRSRKVCESAAAVAEEILMRGSTFVMRDFLRIPDMIKIIIKVCISCNKTMSGGI